MSPSVAENSFPLLLQFKLSFLTRCFWRKFSSQEYKISHSASFKCNADEKCSSKDFWEYFNRTYLNSWWSLHSNICILVQSIVWNISNNCLVILCAVLVLLDSLCAAGWGCHKHMWATLWNTISIQFCAGYENVSNTWAMLCRTVEYIIHTNCMIQLTTTKRAKNMHSSCNWVPQQKWFNWMHI